jgi:hypothetical protein
MAQIRAALKRSILNSLARQAANGINVAPLSDALNAYQDALVSGVKSGRIVEAHTGAGKAVKFRTPVIGDHFRQDDVCEMSQEFLEIYADSVAALAVAGNNSPNDTQILTAMMADDRLQSVTSTRRDYTLMNYPSRF